MISFIANSLRTILFIFLLNDYIKQRFPKKHEEIIIKTFYKVFYLLSVLQINILRFEKYIYESNPRLFAILNNIKKNATKEKNNIEFIVDGKVNYSTNNIFFSNVDNPDVIFPNNSDFIIYSDYTNETDNKCINKKLLTSLIKDETFDYEKSNINFMLCELKYGNKKYKIDLKTDNYNYYLVDNIIDKNFINYYLLKYHNVVLKNGSKDIKKIVDKKEVIEEPIEKDTEVIEEPIEKEKKYTEDKEVKEVIEEEKEVIEEDKEVIEKVAEEKDDKEAIVLTIIDHNVEKIDLDITNNVNYIKLMKNEYIKLHR